MSRSEKQTLGISHADFPHLMTMTALIIAGEAIFALPFHVTRFFRPTFLEVFEFSNMQLGLVQASYGVIAMLAYFPGGQLADMFSARKLLAASILRRSQRTRTCTYCLPFGALPPSCYFGVH